MSSCRRPILPLLVGALVSCAPRAVKTDAAAVPASTAGPPQSPGLQQGDDLSGPTSSRAPDARVPAGPLPGGEEPTPDKALPELRVEALGMHIGGGTNTPDEKAPFHRALEQQFPLFLDCYRTVEDPWAGGSFGVDIKVGRAGGAPTVEQPRTRIRGAAFRDCMLAAFTRVKFDRQKAGPTVLSYSVRFTLGTAKR